MINLSIPFAATGKTEDQTVVLASLLATLIEVARRSADVTVVPLVIDYTNQRVLIGASAASTTVPGKVEVTGDIKILGAGNGLLAPCRNGTNWGRIILENPDSNGNIAISVDTVI